MEYTFVASGRPKAKRRPRLGRGRRAYTPMQTHLAEDAVREAYGNGPKFDGPVHVDVEFHPDHTQVTISNDETWPSPLTADVDNLAKLVLDSLNGTAWEDDRQVHSIHARKYPYPLGHRLRKAAST